VGASTIRAVRSNTAAGSGWKNHGRGVAEGRNAAGMNEARTNGE